MSAAISFFELLQFSARRVPQHPAIVEGAVTLSYKELLDAVERFALYLAHLGVRRGDRVVISMTKSIEEVVAMLAVSRLRATFANISRQWTSFQLLDAMQEVQAKVLCADAQRATQLIALDLPVFVGAIVVSGISPSHPRMVPWEGTSMHAPEPDNFLEKHHPLDADIATIIFTSGSTGKPKGVLLSNLNLLSSIRATTRYLENNAEDRILAALPFCFNYGLGQLISMLCLGGTVVLQRTLMASELAVAINKYGITGLAAIPPIWNDLVDYLKDVPTSFPTLRYITNAGGKCSDRVLDALPEVFPDQRIYLMYGMTEAVRSTYLPAEDFKHKRGSLGKAVPNAEVFIINEKGQLCSQGETGELVHRGSSVAAGYLNNPEASAEKFKSCPALHDLIGKESVCFSGDLVRIDEDGYLWYVGRHDRMIKSSGYRISPTEIEDVLSRAPAVSRVIVFGQDDDRLGQKIVAVIKSENDTILDESGLRKYCRSRMPGYMIPATFHHWEGALPRTGNGKLDIPAIIRACQSHATSFKFTN